MPTEDRLLRREEVEARCGITRTTVYRLMRSGQFPEPIKVGARAVRWPASEIEAWLSGRPRATGESPRGLTAKRMRRGEPRR